MDLKSTSVKKVDFIVFAYTSLSASALLHAPTSLYISLFISMILGSVADSYCKKEEL